jgi:putative acyl-CoA dehydrogenase
VEESILPRLYRQAPLNSIWEGSGNIQCLDVLRALTQSLPAWMRCARNSPPPATCPGSLPGRPKPCWRPLPGGRSMKHGASGRRAVGLAAAGAELLAAGSPAAEAFVRSRLEGGHGLAFGTLPADIDVAMLLERALPQ